MAATLVVALAAIVVAYAPAAWFSRMDHFAHGNLDILRSRSASMPGISPSCSPRIIRHGRRLRNFHHRSLRSASRPGAEFAGPHSIYFQMLGEQGYVGLSLFVLAFDQLPLTCWKLRRQSRQLRADSRGSMPYTEMIQVSLLAYMISGAFLAMAYFDYFWQIVAMTAILQDSVPPRCGAALSLRNSRRRRSCRKSSS